MDDSAPIPIVWEMFDDMEESLARLGRQRWRPWMSSTSLEASLRCVDLYLTRLDLVCLQAKASIPIRIGKMAASSMS
jgi:hypothetical protein